MSDTTRESPRTHAVPPGVVGLLATIGALALAAVTAAAFLAYLRPEFVMDWGNSLLLCY